MKGPPSGYVTPSTVTWFSCMHSSSAAWVFGEARLISSTSRMFANTGPGRNSNSFVRWSKTFTPVTSDGSRSGVNWIRENEQSTDRASALASMVFPTPGKSSMIRCPSAIRQRAASRSVSAGACTTRATLAAIPAIASLDAVGSRAPSTAGLSTLRLEQALRLVEDHGGDALLRRLRDGALALGRDEHDLVVGRVEAHVGARHVVEDDQVQVLRSELLARARDPVRPRLRGEADDDSAVCGVGRQRAEDVGGRLELDVPGRVLLGPLAVAGFGRTVVRHGSGHEHDVGVGARERLALDISCGRRLD